MRWGFRLSVRTVRRGSCVSNQLFTIATLGLLVLAGCNRQAAGPASRVADASAAVQGPPGAAAKADETERGDAEEAAGAAMDGPDRSASSSETPAADAPQPATAKAPPATKPASAAPLRLLLLCEHGPLSADLIVTVDGQPFQDYHAQAMRQIWTAVNPKVDTPLAWQDFLHSDAWRQRWFGNEPLENEQAREQMIYACDVNRNGRVDSNEILRSLLGPQSGGRMISVASQTESLDSGQTADDPLFVWLDENRDGVLNGLELAGSVARLRRLDRNDDAILGGDEIERRSATSPTSRRTREPDVIWLHAATDWNALLFLIEERYAYGSPIQESDIAMSSDMFAFADQNHDGYWDLNEAKRLQEYPADLVLHVPIGQNDVGIRVEFSGDDPARRSWKTWGPQSVVIDCPQGVVRVSRRAASATNDADGVWRQRWEEIDNNHDDQLDREEFLRIAGSLAMEFEAADRDGDAMIAMDELLESIARRRLPREATLQLVAAFDHRFLLLLLDSDGDGLLSERELSDSAIRLGEQVNGRGELRRGSLPKQLRLELGRIADFDAAAPSEEGTSRPRLTSAMNPERPAWFSGMDRNGDGSISRREFPGAVELFERLDPNQDGFLDWPELRPSSPPAAEPQ